LLWIKEKDVAVAIDDGEVRGVAGLRDPGATSQLAFSGSISFVVSRQRVLR